MKLYVVSSSAQESTNSLLTVLILMVLEVNGNDISSFASNVRKYILSATDLLKQHGIFKELNKYLNKFVLTKKISHEDAVEIGAILKSARQSFDRDISIDKAHLELLKACAQNLFNDSDSAWNKIEKNVSILHNAELNAIFTSEGDLEVDGLTYKVAATKIKPLVKKLTGKMDNIFLSQEEAKLARANSPSVLSEYSKYLKVINRSVKHEVFRFVRTKKSPLVSIDVVRSHLNSLGMPNNLPRGFVGGQLDEQGKAYTAEGKQLDKVPYGIVQMNPKYDPSTDSTYVISGVDHVAKYRTLVFLTSNKLKRHSLVQDFLASEDEYKDKWRADLAKKGSEDQILACMVELLYSTSARIGGKDNQTAGEPTYGLSTLQVGHLKFMPTKVIFDYSGKKGTNQYTEYKLSEPTSKKVAELLKLLVANKSADSLVFVFRKKHLSRQVVSAYLKEKGIALTPHKFRQITGTKLAVKLLSKSPFKKSDYPKQAEVERWFKEEALQIGETLHHRNGEKVTSATAIKSYIDPTPIAQFFEELGLRRPTWLPK